jgi:polyhydroxyalkanoate synthesis repressor PhaR
MNEARIIKRYANRKLYDTQHSRYVTLDQISEMIRNGDDVKIIDNKTKEDLTKVTLAQIIFEEEKKQRSFLTLQTMRNIIQNGGESFAHLVSEAQRRVTSILPLRKDGDEKDSQGDEVASAAPQASVNSQITDSVSENSHGEGAGKRRDGLSSLRELREWVQQTQHSIEEWHKRVDDRIRHMVEGFSPFAGLQNDVNALRSRLAELEAKLAGIAQNEGQRTGKAEGVVVEIVKDTSASEHGAREPKSAASSDTGSRG